MGGENCPPAGEAPGRGEEVRPKRESAILAEKGIGLAISRIVMIVPHLTGGIKDNRRSNINI